MEPSLGVMPTVLATSTVPSLWPKPSMMERPVASWNLRNTSGFRASPAVVMCLTVDRSYFMMSWRIIMRSMVGGAQKVVMPYLPNMGRMSSAWKRSKS